MTTDTQRDNAREEWACREMKKKTGIGKQNQDPFWLKRADIPDKEGLELRDTMSFPGLREEARPDQLTVDEGEFFDFVEQAPQWQPE